ncbi:hypothetical protein [Haloarchaeobius iranensis]|nr:hypothetical protein [Haloarchaeobius iranensis]
MKVASAIGISTSCLRFGTQEGLVSAMGDPSEEVSYVERLRVVEDDDGNPIRREPIYNSISRDEWIRVETASEAQSRIYRLLRQEFPRSPELNAHKVESDQSPIGYEIVVRYPVASDSGGSEVTPHASAQSVAEALPNTLEITVGRDEWAATRKGIPVRFSRTQVERAAQTECGDNDDTPPSYIHDWSDIPAGCCVWGWPDGDPGTANGTFYHHKYGEYCLIAAGHCVQAPEAGEPNPSWGNPDLDSPDGYVLDKIDTTDRDYALLRTYSQNTQRRIRHPSTTTTDYDIYGSITDQGIQNTYEATGETVYAQGNVLERVSSQITEYDENNGGGTQQIKFTADVECGDSGGLIFAESEDGYGAYILGIINQFYYQNGVDIGNTAEAVENTYNGFYH